MFCNAGCDRKAVAKGLCLMHYKRTLKHGSTELPERRVPLRDRFDGKYIVNASSGCWHWTGATLSKGYGAINEGGDGRVLKAHRVSYELHVGPIPDGMWVLHRCDNPPCVNPDHLFIGDAMANVRDMDAKGRRVSIGRLWPLADKSGMRRGEMHPAAKLTAEQIAEIRASRDQGKRLAATFNVSQSAISAVRNGKTWTSQ